jgi:hypothetical protein
MERRCASLILCFAIIAFLIAGCQKANPLIGKWQTTQSGFGMSITTTREFKTDGTETMVSGTPPAAMSADMTYTVDGNKLVEAVSRITMGKQTIQVDPSKVPAGSPKNLTETYTLDGDKLTITNSMNGAQSQLIYNRVPAQ